MDVTLCAREAINLPWKVLSFHHGKNGFAEVSKNLARYRSENNFVAPLK